jgi:hypothetical protein
MFLQLPEVVEHKNRDSRVWWIRHRLVKYLIGKVINLYK